MDEHRLNGKIVNIILTREKKYSKSSSSSITNPYQGLPFAVETNFIVPMQLDLTSVPPVLTAINPGSLFSVTKLK